MYHTLIRILAVGLLALAPMLPACACGAGGAGAANAGGIVCTGGARMVGNACYCPTGTTSDGTQCQGQAQQGSCPAGEFEVVGAAGASCFCPDGYVWVDANKNSCSQCAGGSVPNGDYACACPDGTAWDGNQCAQQQVVAQEPQCTGGAIMTDNGCQCPDGAGWDGNNCVAQVTQQDQPQQQQQVHQHRTIRRSVNVDATLTCCVNHAKFMCPNDQAFQACATLQANHGCTPAGGC